MKLVEVGFSVANVNTYSKVSVIAWYSPFGLTRFATLTNKSPVGAKMMKAVVVFACGLIPLLIFTNAHALADDGPADRVRDVIVETAEKLSDEKLSPQEKAAAVNRLRETLNRRSARRDRIEPGQHDRPAPVQPADSQGRSGQDDRRGFGPHRPTEVWQMFFPRFAVGIALEPSDNDTQTQWVVKSVMEGSSAEDAGLQEGDVIIAVNAETLKSPQQLIEVVQRAGADGRDVQLKVRRHDQEMEFTVRPRLAQEQLGTQRLGSNFFWEMIPGQPPVFRGPDLPSVDSLPTWQPNRQLEDLRRQIENAERRLQEQIDDLRDQLNNSPKPPITSAAPSTEDI